MKIYHVIFICVFALAIHVFLIFMNNKSATEKRAHDNAVLFAELNELSVSKINCTGDGDGDGYGTCTITSTDGTKTHLDCTSDFIDVKLWKATGCKELSLIQITE